MLIPDIDDSTEIRTLDIITVIVSLWETVAPSPEVMPSSPLHPTNVHSNSRALSSTSSTRTGNNQQSYTVSDSKSSSKNATRTPTPFPTLSTLDSPRIITKTATIFRSTTTATVHNSAKNWISLTPAIQPTARTSNTALETTDHAHKRRILPLIIAIPVLLSISLIVLNIYYFRRRRRLRAMLLPRVTGDYEDLDDQNGTRPSPRFRMLEPFNISRNVFRAEARNINFKHMAMHGAFDIHRRGKRLNATGESIEQNGGAPSVRRNDEIIGPSHSRGRSTLVEEAVGEVVEQVEALQERLRAVEATMNLDRGLREVTVPPPEYTPNTH